MGYDEMVYNLIATACDPQEDEETKTQNFYYESESEEEKIDMSEILKDVPSIACKQILSIKTVTSDSDAYIHEEKCSICLSKFKKRSIQELMVLKCEHVFHKGCCINWIKTPDA